ncbi:D-alanyl-D-alanine carboxypeptidase/D-alanyl-D-alanine-endopeptidase [Maribellus sediminis]|uniref:D-alanyl-D-alanine carboxypeptidase/D-alanyl-D-alanine endopeptidase n=1 Tax=Maribellus sediminis TaxID=2696285 RepID=UPI0014317915|nr:D-alanyl-D-alanine carboxypeptidase/D-alanyl-D-alanine-endopeptidase [Maribellus sediminis]
MIARFLFVLLFTFGLLLISAQQSFEKSLQDVLSKPEYQNASVGILVNDLESGKELFGLNAEKLLIPASTMKLITTASAIRILGDDYRFETNIGYTGKVNRNKVLKGDLVLTGGADPALGSEYFQNHYFHFLQNWAQQVKNAGIEKIEGNLVLDASIYDSEKIPATWIWEDMGNYYGAGASAFTVYDNMFRITFRSPATVGSPTKIIATYPKIDGMTIKNEVLSANDKRDNAYVFGSPLDKTRVIRGTIPANRRAFTIRAAMQHPEVALAADLQQALLEKGIFISGEVLFESVDQRKLQNIFIQESPTLAEITKVLNYESVNLFAEHFLKQLAVEKYGIGNREKGIELVKKYWQDKGLSADAIFMEDGSGLSHFNAVSPAFFVDLMTNMANDKGFVASLPEAGEGTLYSFSKANFPGRTLQAKSGSMTRVRCYSGYLKADSGKQLVFSIMFNHFSGSHYNLTKEIEDLLLVLKKQN